MKQLVGSHSLIAVFMPENWISRPRIKDRVVGSTLSVNVNVTFFQLLKFMNSSVRLIFLEVVEMVEVRQDFDILIIGEHLIIDHSD